MSFLKTCFKCLEPKPLEAFYAHPRMADGRVGKCKVCARRDTRAHRLANLEVIREADRSRAKQRTRRSQNKSSAIQRAAHRAVARALQRGILVAWPVCAIPTCDSAPEAHHPDYGQPLSVVWLCRAHHAQAHAL